MAIIWCHVFYALSFKTDFEIQRALSKVIKSRVSFHSLVLFILIHESWNTCCQSSRLLSPRCILKDAIKSIDQKIVTSLKEIHVIKSFTGFGKKNVKNKAHLELYSCLFVQQVIQNLVFLSVSKSQHKLWEKKKKKARVCENTAVSPREEMGTSILNW